MFFLQSVFTNGSRLLSPVSCLLSPVSCLLDSVFRPLPPASPLAFRPLLSIFHSWHILAGIMWALFKEFLKFCKQEKKWWLIPLIVLLLVLGAILLFTASSGIAWALYPFM